MERKLCYTSLVPFTLRHMILANAQMEESLCILPLIFSNALLGDHITCKI